MGIRRVRSRGRWYYTGKTTVSGGTLAAGSILAFGNGSAVTVSSGTLDLAGYSNRIGSLAGTGTVTDSSTAAATLTTGGANASTSFCRPIVPS